MRWSCDCPDCRNNHQSDPNPKPELLTKIMYASMKCCIIGICLTCIAVMGMEVMQAAARLP